MAETLLYVLPLILGRTFDMNKMMVGVDIFPLESVSNPSVLQNPFSDTRYSIVDGTKEARDFLDVGGSFSLNIKGGMFKAGASGAYLADSYNRENTVEILVKATYETVRESLPYDASPVSTWKQMGSLGTHYVRGITYGGELLASIRLACNNTRDKQHIKASLEVAGRIQIFDVGAEVEGEYMKDIAKTVDKMEIKIYSSVPIGRIPHSMEDLKKALDDFPKDMAKYNGGKGVPLNVELWPLNFLDSERPQYIKNNVLQVYLDHFEQKFDDLMNTRNAISDWMKTFDDTLSTDLESKVGNLYGDVQNILSTFYAVVGNLDISEGPEQLQPAIDAYGKDISGYFYKKYQILRQQVVDDKGSWTRERGTGATYIHWGKANCSQGAEKIYVGHAAGPAGSGGGSNYLCLPEESHVSEVKGAPNFAVLEGATYQMPNQEASQIACSACRLAARGSVQAFPGLRDCARDWDLLYRGILMSGSNNNTGTAFICLATQPTLHDSKLSDSPLVASWTKFNESEPERQGIMPCIVCSK